jgi:hypothetical protein
MKKANIMRFMTKTDGVVREQSYVEKKYWKINILTLKGTDQPESVTNGKA